MCDIILTFCHGTNFTFSPTHTTKFISSLSVTSHFYTRGNSANLQSQAIDLGHPIQSQVPGQVSTLLSYVLR